MPIPHCGKFDKTMWERCSHCQNRFGNAVRPHEFSREMNPGPRRYFLHHHRCQRRIISVSGEFAGRVEGQIWNIGATVLI